MLKIAIPETEYWDSVNERFINLKPQVLSMEHSLISISKWESKWHKPFNSDDKKTYEESLDYLRCMTLTPNVNPLIYRAIPDEAIARIDAYIHDPMTATTIKDTGNRKSREVVTSELVYYWMITLGIPMECQKWHFNRLLTLIRVCEAKNNPKKMGRREALEQQRALNRARRAKYNTKG